MGIPLVRAHLPFDAISTQYQQHEVLAQDPGIVGNALNTLLLLGLRKLPKSG
jgi:hypothetical protein